MTNVMISEIGIDTENEDNDECYTMNNDFYTGTKYNMLDQRFQWVYRLEFRRDDFECVCLSCGILFLRGPGGALKFRT